MYKQQPIGGLLNSIVPIPWTTSINHILQEKPLNSNVKIFVTNKIAVDPEVDNNENKVSKTQLDSIHNDEDH